MEVKHRCTHHWYIISTKKKYIHDRTWLSVNRKTEQENQQGINIYLHNEFDNTEPDIFCFELYKIGIISWETQRICNGIRSKFKKFL